MISWKLSIFKANGLIMKSALLKDFQRKLSIFKDFKISTSKDFSWNQLFSRTFQESTTF